MGEFWSNPELVRHVRADLRRERALTAAAIVAVLLILLAMSCWRAAEAKPLEFFRLCYAWMMWVQGLLLAFWCLSACGQAISRERELKTFDFLRTTRLTAAELALGKILGAPIMAYFLVGISLPFAVIAGLAAGYGLAVIIFTYVLMFAFALFLSLIGLWVSMLLERPRPGSAVGVLFLLGYLGLGLSALPFTPVPGFAALSPYPALASLYPEMSSYGNALGTPTLFGLAIPWVVASLLLYASYGAWLALMLVRNLKRDLDEVRMLSRWQAIGFAVFINILFYAFLNPHNAQNRLAVTGVAVSSTTVAEVTLMALGMNSMLLYLVGLATLTPKERLKVWWRKHSSGAQAILAEDGIPWPWPVMSAAIGLLLLACYAAGSRGMFSGAEWNLRTAGFQLLDSTVFAVRDILFLQWCVLTRMKRPVFKGILFLFLYYFAATVVSTVFMGVTPGNDPWMYSLLMPFSSYGKASYVIQSVGIALQLGVSLVIVQAIIKRLSKPAFSPALSVAAGA